MTASEYEIWVDGRGIKSTRSSRRAALDCARDLALEYPGERVLCYDDAGNYVASFTQGVRDQV